QTWTHTTELCTLSLHDALPIYTLRVSTASEGRPRKMAEEQNLSKGASYGLSAAAMERLGIHFSRYGLVLTLLLIGAIITFLFTRSEEHTSALQSRFDLVCRLLL